MEAHERRTNDAMGDKTREDQHSVTLTASPPREVSLYLVFMSAPVSRMVLITSSSDTLWPPSPRSASRAALIALTAPMALRSMQGLRALAAPAGPSPQPAQEHR